jgi:hypothetical protein
LVAPALGGGLVRSTAALGVDGLDLFVWAAAMAVALAIGQWAWERWGAGPVRGARTEQASARWAAGVSLVRSPDSPVRILLWALVPLAAFLFAYHTAGTIDLWSSANRSSALVWVVLPSALAIGAARPGVARWLTVGLLSVVTALVGTAAADTGNQWAGLSVIAVPALAVPLAVVMFVVRLVADAAQRRSTRHRYQRPVNWYGPD